MGPRKLEVNDEIRDFEQAFDKWSTREEYEDFITWLQEHPSDRRRMKRLAKDVQWTYDNGLKARSVPAFMAKFEKEHPFRFLRLSRNLGWLKNCAEEFGLNPETIIWHL